MTCRLRAATSSRTILAVRDETTWGQLSDHQPVGLAFSTHNLRNEKAFTNGSSSPAFDRMLHDGHEGSQDPGGPVLCDLPAEGAWGILWRHALGACETTPYDTGLWEHSLSGASERPVGFTLDAAYSGGVLSNMVRYTGCRINDMFLAAVKGAACQCRATIVAGAEEVLRATSISPAPTYSLDEAPMIVRQATVEMALDGVHVDAILSCTRVELLVSNNVGRGGYSPATGSGRRHIPDGVRRVSGGLEMLLTEEAWDQYENYLTNSKTTIRLRVDRGSKHWIFSIPGIKLRGAPGPQVAGRGTLRLPFSFFAYSEEASSDITVTIVNGDESLFTSS